MGMTITEKILARASDRDEVKPGDLVNGKIDRLMTMDFLGPIMFKLLDSLEVDRVWDPDRVVAVCDHLVPVHDVKTAELLKTFREYVAKYQVNNFYDMGQHGISHQIMVEEGFVTPGSICVGTDSHSTMYGALNAFSCGVSTTDAASICATGQLWFRIPSTVRFELSGQVQKEVTGKDVVLAIMGKMRQRGTDMSYKAMEFGGSGIHSLSIADRLTVANMAAETGCKNAVLEADEQVINYLRGRARSESRPVAPDAGADYDEVHKVDIGGIGPQIACPPTPDNVKPVEEVEGIRIHQAYLGSCTNGRLEDLEQAASILKGKKVARGVRLIVVPATQRIYLEAVRRGIVEVLIDAGAVVDTPSCAACAGLHTGLLAAGEVVIASTNRNFVGRMGSPKSDVYLASAATVAASALVGAIADPRKLH